MPGPETLFIHAPPNESTIKELYAFISLDETGEGVISMHSAEMGGWLPMVTAKLSVVERMKTAARAIAKQRGKPVKLVKFTVREEIELFGGQ